MKKYLLSLFLLNLFLPFFNKNNCACQPYFTRPAKNAYFFHTTDYPNDNASDWGGDDWAPNGIAHDKDNWFICSVSRAIVGNTDNLNYCIWKIPVSLDLNASMEHPSVKSFNLFYSTLDPVFKKYGHAGDIDVCTSPLDNKDYLVVPLTSNKPGSAGIPIVAFFRASNLEFVNYAKLTNQKDAGWCAVSAKDGRLYSSFDDATHFIKYRIAWDTILHQLGNHNGLICTDNYVGINDEWGRPLSLKNMQGGEFTEDGKLLYISSGLLGGGCGETNYQDGLHVFEVSSGSWDRIQRSTNKFRPPFKQFCFDFNFDNGGCFGDEPEGLTIWDLNNGRAPHVNGQLHVLLDDHNFWTSSKEYIRHYRDFKGSNDITVAATSISGAVATDPAIVSFLHPNHSSCAAISNNAPSVFPPGKTPVIFTVTDNASLDVKDTGYIHVVAAHDECSTALRLYTCNKTITDNYAASRSSGLPIFGCNAGSAKDVWFIVYPPSPVFSVEHTK